MDLQLDGRHRPVIVVGGGQAGLSMSRCLAGAGVEHVVLERERAGHEWSARRWDSFCLVTPNWQCRLPGFPYPGDDPDGFMVRDEIVEYLQQYKNSFDVPLVEGVAATRLRQLPGGGFRLATTHGELTADHVVVATGPYQVPLKPRLAEKLPEHVVQLHSSEYRNPRQLPDGEVLVVGTGQSGCQIAEDLHLAGRRVHLAVGSAPRVARRYRGRDVVAWLEDMGYYARGIDEFADADAVRFRANHYVTGRDGGHDIDLRAFAREGMRLHGRLTGVHNGQLVFADDLRRNLDAADAVSEGIKDSIDAHITARGIAAPKEARYVPVWHPADEAGTLDHTTISAVVWSTGFGRDHRWIDVPVFDGKGYPTHRRGVTSCPGLFFLGLPWQHTWGSGRFCGVGADAEYLTQCVLAGERAADVRWISGTPVNTAPDDDWIAPRTVA
ncbi:MSMEG_0569 family flavin-dependent oxidoreductase [Amycolatopsis sp. FDAARGOS 1241]|uniref:MSMEG_0569 family flavin-dependent oxidoreductase n=1 Tax=Amycolatopsis sp. FDAARGOS 1241 TaxID=2778070 RepID=UPI001950A8D4|nr:MSMEG_0569 family flavin-dependent oxidoreductase [Amycolatopsis sp. FDAARGOS 1241]QRP48061.1 MSMEG_0569 family flavin-dependent oxidoreductase [Amycolatopsis sp. FDAARGOS 1241]